MKRQIALVAGGVAALAACTWSATSFAQGTTVVQAPPPQTNVVAGGRYAETTTGYTGPNRALIGTGLVTFGLAYIPAVIVAGESSQEADHHLYVPVVGPWLDLANRPACGGGGGIGNASNIGCDTESTNKVLLVVSGVFQGLGVLSVVGGLLSPEHGETVATATTKPGIHFAPTTMGAGTGVGAAAFGAF